MITIGLTGSIGMGKTETAKIFKKLGLAVFDSDAAVHDFLGPDGQAVEAVEKAFPGVAVDGQIDRKKLGMRVFNDDEALKKLEQILHPMVMAAREEFTAHVKGDMVVYDIPLLFEKGYDKEIDYIVVVSAPFQLQQKRVLERPGMTEERFNEILSRQMPDSEKRRRADFIIQTDKGLDYAEQQAKEMLKKLMESM